MKSEHVEEMLTDAAYKVVWGDHKPKYEWLAEYCPGTMLDQFELMALKMRSQYGFNQLPESD
jgi:hypothetical protein